MFRFHWIGRNRHKIAYILQLKSKKCQLGLRCVAKSGLQTPPTSQNEHLMSKTLHTRSTLRFLPLLAEFVTSEFTSCPKNFPQFQAILPIFRLKSNFFPFLKIMQVFREKLCL